MNWKFVLAAVTASLITGAASAATLSLTGTVRDFRGYGDAKHPDMQRAIDGGVQTGKVSATLDANGKPVFVGAENVGSFTNQANFSQWYRDVAGVNLSSTFGINLVETAPNSGIFEYASTSFFPIDGAGFGNEGQSHNYHFTYELTGLTSFKASDTFSFTGDDDLWVYVDGKLVLDIGGVHGAVTKGFSGADLLALGLSTGTNYAYSIFFAERHTTQSNFSITTSLPLAPVPLPAAGLLLIAGLGALGAARRFRKAA